MVYKRSKEGSWFYRFKRNGVTIRVCTKQGSKRVAEELERAERTRLARGEAGLYDHRDIPTLKAFIPRYLEGVTAKASTKHFYEQKVKDLLAFPALAGARLDRIDENLIQRFLTHRRQQVAYPGRPAVKHKVSITTVNHALRTLRRILRVAEELKVIQRAPRIHILPGEVHREYVLPLADEPAYLAAAPEPLRSIATVLVDTGLRLGECLALEWRDVHLDDEPYVYVRAGKTRAAVRAVALTKRVTALLRARQATITDSLVFSNRQDHPWAGTYLDLLHRRVRRALKLPETFVLHSLRHTALTRLGASGADVHTIKTFAGHSSILISQRYVHPSPEHVRAAVPAMDKANQKKGPIGGPRPSQHKQIKR